MLGKKQLGHVMNMSGDGDRDRSDASTELSVGPSSHGFNEEVAARKTVRTHSVNMHHIRHLSHVRRPIERVREIGSVRRSNLDEFS